MREYLMRQSAAKDEVLTANFIYRSEVTQREITNGVHRGTVTLKRGMTTVRPAPHAAPPSEARPPAAARPPPAAAASRGCRRRNRPPLSLSLSLSRARAAELTVTLTLTSSPSPNPDPDQEEVCKLVRLDVAKLGEVHEIPSVAGRSMVRIRTASAPSSPPHLRTSAPPQPPHCLAHIVLAY